ncbi:MAG TPA: hypothetical protein ENK55_10385, partial [Actinobacteria bacterium]|nr:hypothetical protein [Actinomycetota bacterium]
MGTGTGRRLGAIAAAVLWIVAAGGPAAATIQSISPSGATVESKPTEQIVTATVVSDVGGVSAKPWPP